MRRFAQRQADELLRIFGQKMAAAAETSLISGSTEKKVVLEIKKGDTFSKAHIDQVNAYLKSNNVKLGILANFGREGVKFKRIINFEGSGTDS